MSRADGVEVTGTLLSIFGERHPRFYDMRPLADADGRMPEQIVVATSIPSGYMPRRLLLPHQLYTDTAEKLLAETRNREVWVYPVFDHSLWTRVRLEGHPEPAHDLPEDATFEGIDWAEADRLADAFEEAMDSDSGDAEFSAGYALMEFCREVAALAKASGR